MQSLHDTAHHVLGMGGSGKAVQSFNTNEPKVCLVFRKASADVRYKAVTSADEECLTHPPHPARPNTHAYMQQKSPQLSKQDFP